MLSSDNKTLSPHLTGMGLYVPVTPFSLSTPSSSRGKSPRKGICHCLKSLTPEVYWWEAAFLSLPVAPVYFSFDLCPWVFLGTWDCRILTVNFEVLVWSVHKSTLLLFCSDSFCNSYLSVAFVGFISPPPCLCYGRILHISALGQLVCWGLFSCTLSSHTSYFLVIFGVWKL